MSLIFDGTDDRAEKAIIKDVQYPISCITSKDKTEYAYRVIEVSNNNTIDADIDRDIT